MAELDELGVEDLVSAAQSRAQSSSLRAITAMDASPDDAAESIRLSDATGVPAPAINADLESFQNRVKQTTTASIVRNNPYISNYIASHPLAAQVANDDWGQLDAVSKSLTRWAKSEPDNIVQGFKRGFGDSPIGGQFIEPYKDHPFLTALAASAATVPELAIRGINAAIFGTAYGIAGPEQGENLAQMATDPGLQESLIGIGPHGVVAAAGLAAWAKVAPKIARVAPFAEAGKDPLPGMLPEYDKFRADHNAEGVDQLKETTSEALKSLLNDRNSDEFKKFIAQHTDAEIGISGDVIAKLYGDKLPDSSDSMFGWVPDIQDKVANAIATGDDLKIPLTDWLANADKTSELMKTLGDDIRTEPGGITANEVKQSAELDAISPPAEPVPGELPSIRAATALEPLLSVGDRKLKLERLAGAEGSMFGPEHGFHDFSLNDEKGNPVGTLNLSEQAGGKQIYVEMVNGIGGLGPRDFGPALMRDLLRQIKAEFPNATSITGHRVSGAREKAGVEMTAPAPVVKLENPRGWDVADHNDLVRILEGGQWETFSPATQAYIKPYAERSVEDRKLIDVISDELDRIVPKKLQISAADRIESSHVEGQTEPVTPTGIYIRYREAYPILLFSMEGPNPLGTARHEAIHHLRNYGFFSKEEWATLETAANAHGWTDAFNIHERYPSASHALKLEEAIADAYKHWKDDKDFAVPPEVHGIFEKMKAFFEAIKERIGQLLGKEPTWEDIFKKVDTGEVGARDGKPLDARSFDEKAAIENFRKAANDNETKLNAQSVTDELQSHFKETVTDPHEEFIKKYDELHAFGQEIQKKGNWTELNVARYNKLGREMDPEWENIPFDPLGLATHDKGALDEKASIAEPPEGGSRVFERSQALGVTKDFFNRYDKITQKKYASDMEHALKRATAEKTREQTKEWKANRKALRVEVADSIKQRPDVAADLFFGSGELYGKKVPLGSVKMDASKLNDVQKAALPRGYYGEHGFAPDDVAGMFGYGSGDSMVEALANYNVAKTAAGKMSAKDFVSRVTDTETDRQMAAKYGNLQENIIDSAKLQATSEVQQDALHMEVEKFAAEHGVTFGDKVAVRQQLQDQFAKMPIGSVKSDQYLRAAGKAGRLIESGLLHGKPQEAFAAKLQQYYATVLAHEAAKLEAKELPKFDKLTKKFTKAFDPTKSTGIDAEYSLFIRDILSRVGRKYGMSVQGLEQGIAKSGYTDLGDFVAKTNALYGMSGVELPVADFLKDPTFRKGFKELTVEEFRGLNDSVTALNTFGRAVDKITREGEKVDRKEWVQKAGEQLSNKFKPQDLGATGKPGVVRTYFASLMNMETLFGRFDGRDAEGLFTKMFVYPGARAANAKDTLMREYSKGLKEAGVIKDADKKLVSPLIDPRTKKPVTDFTRENLATIISNMGNDYNWKVLTKGWNIDPDVLWKWVEANSTIEDVQRAQKIGELFNKAKGESDNVYRNMYGVAPQDIQVRPFTMHGVNFDGWYHPIIYDPIRSKLSKLTTGDPSKNEFENFWPSVANPYTKKRTGNVDVISLSQSMVPIKLNQMLHDIAFREFVHESAKVVRDDGFRNHVSTYYGPEYVDSIDTWLSRVAGNASFNDNAMAMATRLSNQIRGNVVSTYIAFSPTTIQKHGLTAAVMSAKEVGTKKFSRVFAEVAADSLYHATMDLFGRGQGLGDTLWQFVRKNSEEIQRRDRNFEQTLGGQMDLTLGKSGLRQKFIELGSKGVAFSDMLSAVPTWLAKYREAMDETADAGRATDLADRAVRRAHGSTAITNQPTIVSHTNPLSPWLTTIYGFFGTNMQRRFEIAHDINDAFKLGKSGDISSAAKAAPNVMANIMTYVIWPGLVEEAVSSQFFDDKKKGGLIGHALSFTLGTAASTFIGIRDLAYGLTHDKDPQAGLISSPLHDVMELIRDAKKDHPLDKAKAGKVLQDAITVFGDATGMGPKHIGTAAHYGLDVLTHQQRPKTAGDIYRGVITGQQHRKELR